MNRPGDRWVAMHRAATEFQPLPNRGSFAPASFLRPTAERQFVPMSAGRSSFTSGLPIRTQAPALPAPTVETAPEVPEAPVAAASPAAPSHGREAALEARIAELEAALVERQQQHDEVLRQSYAEHNAALANAQAVEAKAASNSQRLGRLIAEMGSLRDRAMVELREEAGAVLLTAARRLAGRSLQVQPGVLEGLVNECIETLGGKATIIRVHPEDVERVQAAVESGVRVIPDASIPAGCVVEGDGTRVTATLAQGLAVLDEELNAWRRSA